MYTFFQKPSWWLPPNALTGPTLWKRLVCFKNIVTSALHGQLHTKSIMVDVGCYHGNLYGMLRCYHWGGTVSLWCEMLPLCGPHFFCHVRDCLTSGISPIAVPWKFSHWAMLLHILIMATNESWESFGDKTFPGSFQIHQIWYPQRSGHSWPWWWRNNDPPFQLTLVQQQGNTCYYT